MNKSQKEALFDACQISTEAHIMAFAEACVGFKEAAKAARILGLTEVGIRYNETNRTAEWYPKHPDDEHLSDYCVTIGGKHDYS